MIRNLKRYFSFVGKDNEKEIVLNSVFVIVNNSVLYLLNIIGEFPLKWQKKIIKNVKTHSELLLDFLSKKRPNEHVLHLKNLSI